MYYVYFGKGYEKGEETLDGTRKMAIAFMGFKDAVMHADISPKQVWIYKSKSKEGFVGRVIYKHQRYWWVTYSAIQELSENGKVKKLMTYIPL